MKEPQDFWAQKAKDLKRERKFEEAVKILDKVKMIKEQEKDENFWYRKAIHFYEISEFDQAKFALKKNLEKHSQSYDVFFLMGKILYKLKEYEQSLEYYNKAFEEYSRLQLRNSSKVDQMKNVRKFEEAVIYADKVYQQKEINTEFWHFKGMALFELGKYSEASLCFETILEEDHKNTGALYELAKSELFAGNKKNSINILIKACKMDSDVKKKLRVDKDFESIYREKLFSTVT